MTTRFEKSLVTFNYLGVVLNYTGSFILNQHNLSGKGLKAVNALLSNIETVEWVVLLAMLVRSGGFSGVERIHMRFCIRVLGVKVSTRNAGINGKLGRYPLYVAR